MVDLSAATCVVAAIVAIIVLLRLSFIENRLNSLSRLDAKLDLLLKQAGIDYDPHKDMPDQVILALQRGEKIQAIKLYREATGVGLKEAKDAVEEIQGQASIRT
jgi:ribosomal protein L7/L12